jgi:hypothetical protein
MILYVLKQSLLLDAKKRKNPACGKKPYLGSLTCARKWHTVVEAEEDEEAINGAQPAPVPDIEEVGDEEEYHIMLTG